MKAEWYALALATFFFCSATSACEFTTDCEIGSKCIKQAGKLEGVCMGGMNPGNRNDRRPFRDSLDLSESVGDTCQFHTDCGIGAKCLKESGRLEGVCVRSR